ncbi:MAG TPA: tetratricopeptide repeat protein, partial [Chromatiaceae bacterium]|nr:tetratricopeptide repeat protein [Chromatiaceae bacterium]
WYLFRAGKLSEAKEAALKSLEVTPGNEVAPAHLARIHLQLGEAEQALTWVERALERTPARTELHRLKKRILAIRE